MEDAFFLPFLGFTEVLNLRGEGVTMNERP
jgi:hypothetical protein